VLWLIIIAAIVAGENIVSPWLSTADQWELALGAKYLSIAVVFQLLLVETKTRGLLFRSLVALFCIGAWVEFVFHLAWQFVGFNSATPIMIGFSVWLIATAKRSYTLESYPLIPGHVYILIHRPIGTWAVIKSLVGFPADSISVYANGQAWSFRRNSGMFALYSAGPAVLSVNIAVDTGKPLTPEMEKMLDDLVGQPRFPGTKCVWAIRHVLRKIGGKFAPRWCDYIPGIFAAKLLRGRE